MATNNLRTLPQLDDGDIEFIVLGLRDLADQLEKLGPENCAEDEASRQCMIDKNRYFANIIEASMNPIKYYRVILAVKESDAAAFAIDLDNLIEGSETVQGAYVSDSYDTREEALSSAGFKQLASKEGK